MARYTGTRLVSLELQNAESDVYEVDTGQRLILTRIEIFNPNASSETVELFMDYGSGSVPFDITVLAENERVEFYDLGLVLNATNKVRGKSTTDEVVWITLYGALEVVT